PRSKVFGGEVLTGDLAQIAIDVVRVDLPSRSVLVDVLEEHLAGQLFATFDDPGDAAIGDPDLDVPPALAAKYEADGCPMHLHVAVAQRRQAKRSVVARVL